MAGEDRLTALLAQAKDPAGTLGVTGIDFIQVLDPAVQTQLRVFFFLNPDELDDPIIATADLPVDIPSASVEIQSLSGGLRIPVVQATYQSILVGGRSRTVLDLTTAAPGDFSLYQLTLNTTAPPHLPDPRIDRFFNGLEFSFKQGCPSPLDCKPPDLDCPPEARVDFPVDYLARDFVSLRNALLDYASQRYPNWHETIEADLGVMLTEVMAALGDELSYIQDRYAREAHWETLTQRRSLRHHARLIDYPIDEGRSASTVLEMQVSPDAGASNSGGVFVVAGSLVWAPGDRPIPFEIGPGLAARTMGPPEQYWVHAAWNAMPVHVPDASQPCLPVGSTELFLVGHFPLDEHLPTPPANAAERLRFWEGRWMLLQTQPQDPSLPQRRHWVQIQEVEPTTDPLCLDAADQPLLITRLRWATEQALPFEVCLPDLSVHGNILNATAGETRSEYFATRLPETPLPADVQLALERQGPLDEIRCQRSLLYRYSLQQAETRGLGWLGEGAVAQPELELQEVDPTTLDPRSPPDFWHWQSTLLDSTGLQDHVTLEHGTWRRVIGFQRLGETIVHNDYASGAGFTLRFGDGEFGRIPDAGTVFRVRYRTGPGVQANLPADAVTQLAHPVNGTVSFALLNPDGTPAALDLATTAITNPFAITNGRDPQPAEEVKQLAPEAFRALTFRAVRPEDYAEIAERLPWVQRAGARFRWTGSWLSTFVTVDPLNAFELSPERRRELAQLMDCVRQVGREVFVRNPRYLNLDLEICFCVEPFAYLGQVQARVRDALLGAPPPGFFHPDRFTFGTPLKRSALEAAIQAVPGVKGVEQMRLRIRGVTDWRSFDELILTVGADQILQLRNDPRFPEQGSLRLIPRQAPTPKEDP
ncbi:hypothetical protein [Lyngbya confervoides]|uniref:Baseplate protein J-like domain-containing protein n=1 Tax=Lyngbya confervoides BDU141951 TaxID=1574623 RepID=A0ABD4T430_9CYAN|nr:hypothetical protein [Lyngbya confervoides]MCM1983272.1 hypothetical protein [Lyngbya confervoides BDU141951]